MKHREHFPKFFELMLEEMDQHHPSKGDTWLDSDKITIERSHGTFEIPMRNFLVIKLEEAFDSFMEAGDVTRLDHIANYCAMIRMRTMLEADEEGWALG